MDLENEDRKPNNVFKLRILVARDCHSHLTSSIFSAKQGIGLTAKRERAGGESRDLERGKKATEVRLC